MRAVWVCLILMADDETLRRYAYTYNRILRHEMGHCNGWKADHSGGRVRGDRYDARRSEPRVYRTVYRADDPDGKRDSWLWRPTTTYNASKTTEITVKIIKVQRVVPEPEPKQLKPKPVFEAKP